MRLRRHFTDARNGFDCDAGGGVHADIQRHQMRAGAEAVRKTLRAAAECGVETLTLYAFSSENWRRPAQEISAP